MSDSPEDQIHVPTPTRREQARRDGDIPKSFELAAALQMIGALVAAYILLGSVGRWLRTWTTNTWSEAGAKLTVSPAEFNEQLQTTINSAAGTLLPIMAAMMLIGIASHWLQTGPLFLFKRVAPDISRLGPGHWKQQLFSISSLAHLLVGVPKLVVAITAFFASVWFQRSELVLLANYPVDTMLDKMFLLISSTTFHVALALLATSGIDFWLKLVGHQRRLRMTDQQLRDEMRMQNGDPQTRNRQREMRRVA